MKRTVALLFTLVACGGTSGQPEPTACDHHAGGGLADFDVPCDPGAGGVFVTASGEAFAKSGYAFPPANPDDVVFVDGWSIKYDRVLTTVDHITLSTGPDTVPTDQSQCADASGKPILCGSGSDVIAEVDGPFALDLHVGGPLPDANGADMDATPIGALTGRNKESNDAFDPASKYAFGFETVAATTSAKNVNLDAAAIADYMEMAQKHYTTMLVGTATWLGNAQGSLTNSGCTQTTAYDFSVIPKTIKFRIGLPAPTVYRNAQNPTLMGNPEPNEEHPRGVVTVANTSTIAQVTLHLDHAFWESFVHDSPAHFDQFAAKVAGKPSPASITLEDYKGFALRPFVDVNGVAVPWRSCLPAADYSAPGTGSMGFDTLSVNVDPTATCVQGSCTSIRDFYDYTLYNHSTFGHLNADGLSFVDRQYPSPK